MTHTVIALKNALLNQPTAALGNYFGLSETLFCSSMGLVKLRAVPLGFQLEEVMSQYCISAACTSTVLAKGMKQHGNRHLGVEEI